MIVTLERKDRKDSISRKREMLQAQEHTFCPDTSWVASLTLQNDPLPNVGPSLKEPMYFAGFSVGSGTRREESSSEGIQTAAILCKNNELKQKLK